MIVFHQLRGKQEILNKKTAFYECSLVQSNKVRSVSFNLLAIIFEMTLYMTLHNDMGR